MQVGDEEPAPLTVAPAATNLWMYQGVGRSVKMLYQAYTDLVANLGNAVPHESLQILVAMPDPEDRSLDLDPEPGISRNQRLQDYMALITRPLFDLMGAPFADVPLQCVFGDRVAFPRILEKAIRIVQEETR